MGAGQLGWRPGGFRGGMIRIGAWMLAQDAISTPLILVFLDCKLCNLKKYNIPTNISLLCERYFI